MIKILKILGVLCIALLLYAQIQKIFFPNIALIDERENFASDDSGASIWCIKQMNVCGGLWSENTLKMVIQAINEEQKKPQKRCSLYFIDNTWLDVANEEDEFPNKIERRERLTFLKAKFSGYSGNKLYDIEFKDPEQFEPETYTLQADTSKTTLKLSENETINLSMLNKLFSFIETDKLKEEHKEYTYILLDKSDRKCMQINYYNNGSSLSINIF